MPERLTTWNLLLLIASMSISIPGISNSPDEISSETLEYYLRQAFNADKPELRLSVNHIGMITEALDNTYVVTAVLDGYPAQVAGLRRGDRLLSVNSEPFHPFLSFNDTTQLVARKVPVQLAYSRNGTEQQVSIVPVFENLYDSYRTATANSVQEFSSGNKVIGYVKLWSLSRNTNDKVMLSRMLASVWHCDGLILDLRDGYGFIEGDDLDWFFGTRNNYFQLSEAGASPWQPGNTTMSDHDYYGKAMVVIQNHNTRSGLELFAYQLSKSDRIISLGNRTAGEMGDWIGIDDPDLLRYHPASGAVLDGAVVETTGIPPEIFIEFPLDQSSASDLQLDAAVMTLMEFM